MSLSLLFRAKRGAKFSEVGENGEILSLELDATLSESHEYDAEITSYPIEDGSNINDNIRRIPERLLMTGFVSNTPINSIQERLGDVVEKVGGLLKAKNLSRSESDPSNNVEYALDTLLTICGRKIDGSDIDPRMITIVTGLRSYKDMAIQSLRIPRDGTTGNAMRFEATFIKMQKVKTETVAIPNPKPADKDLTQSKVDNGKQTPPKASDTVETKTSALKTLFDKAVR